MPNVAPIRFDGLLLAGGRSIRFGSDKRLASLRGEALVVHAARALRAAVCGGTVYLATGVARRPLPGTFAMSVLGDERPLKGPLGALAAALARARTGIVVLACDTPLVRSHTLVQLAALGLRRDRPAAVRSVRGWEPLVAYYPKWVLNDVRAALDQGQLAPHRMLERLPTVALWLTGGCQLANVNRPGDLVALGERP